MKSQDLFKKKEKPSSKKPKFSLGQNPELAFDYKKNAVTWDTLFYLRNMSFELSTSAKVKNGGHVNHFLELFNLQISNLSPSNTQE